MVHEAFRAVKIPILGMGGTVTPEDAVQFLLAGATAILEGAASYAAPCATARLAKALESRCRTHNIEKVSTLTGVLEIPHD